MKRGTIAAVISALAGLGVAGLALGLPIDPAASTVSSTAELAEPLVPEESDADRALRLFVEAPAGTLDPDTGSLPRDFSFGETVQVPEPDSVVLFGLGMILLGVVGRRREEAATGL